MSISTQPSDDYSENDADLRPYRPCVGLMLINKSGKVFVGNRIDTPGAHWQMPQGGIDEGETAHQAAIRELYEEVGCDKNSVKLLGESKKWHYYDLPKSLSERIWDGKFRGQRQKWFLFLLTAGDDIIQLDNHHAEFSEWKWLALGDLTDNIVHFKKQTYEAVLKEFSDIIRAELAG